MEFFSALNSSYCGRSLSVLRFIQGHVDTRLRESLLYTSALNMGWPKLIKIWENIHGAACKLPDFPCNFICAIFMTLLWHNIHISISLQFLKPMVF